MRRPGWFLAVALLMGCSGTGGSLLLTPGSKPALVENNLFYQSTGCGIVCREVQGAEGATVRNNLFWLNSPRDIDQSASCTIGLIGDNIFDTDPLLCGPETDNYTVADNSPALAANPPIGVWLTPGCGEGIPVERTTLGSIKVRFRSGE